MSFLSRLPWTRETKELRSIRRTLYRKSTDDEIPVVFPRDRRLPSEPWDDYIDRITRDR